MKVLISQRAEDDLAHIYGQIAANNLEPAERFRAEVEKALTLIGRHPEIGARPGWQTRHRRLRFWVVSCFHTYLIYDDLGDDAVAIERVLDGRRDVRRIIEEGIENPPN